MSIRVSNVLSAYEVYSAPKAGSPRATRAQEKRDMVALSEQARDYQTASRALKSVPDIREGLVSEIQSKIQSGTYNVNSGSVADKILGGI